MLKILTVFILLLSGCGSQDPLPDWTKEKIYIDEDPRDITSTDPAFFPYIEQFEKDCKISVSTPIGFEEIEKEGVIGRCKVFVGVETGVEYRQVGVDEVWWDSSDEFEREWLIYHELGHCELNRGHDDEFLEDGYPKSIMHSRLPNGLKNRYRDNREYWIKELCGGK